MATDGPHKPLLNAATLATDVRVGAQTSGRRTCTGLPTLLVSLIRAQEREAVITTARHDGPKSRLAVRLRPMDGARTLRPPVPRQTAR